MAKSILLIVNKREYQLDIEPDELLVDILRDRLNLTGTKKGCGSGDCGACTVLVEGIPVVSCLTLGVAVEHKEITTVEGLSLKGDLTPLQQAFIKLGAVQCGYCTPGILMVSKALLDENSHPSDEEIRTALSGNLCRCTGYKKIFTAIKEVSKLNLGGGK